MIEHTKSKIGVKIKTTFEWELHQKDFTDPKLFDVIISHLGSDQKHLMMFVKGYMVPNMMNESKIIDTIIKPIKDD